MPTQEMTQEQRESLRDAADALATRYERAGKESEWYRALFFTALGKYKDWRKALIVADLMFAESPTMPAAANSGQVSPEAAEDITNQFPPEFFTQGGAGAE